MDRDGTGELVAQVRAATASGAPLRIVGGDTKRFYGRAIAGAPLSTRGHAGILRHDPAENQFPDFICTADYIPDGEDGPAYCRRVLGVEPGGGPTKVAAE